MVEFKELEEFEEEYWKSNWSRMDLFLAEKVRQQQKEIEKLNNQLDEMTADRNLMKDIAESCECNN